MRFSRLYFWLTLALTLALLVILLTTRPPNRIDGLEALIFSHARASYEATFYIGVYLGLVACLWGHALVWPKQEAVDNRPAPSDK